MLALFALGLNLEIGTFYLRCLSWGTEVMQAGESLPCLLCFEAG